MNHDKIQQYAADPMAFFGCMPIRVASGLVPFHTVWTAFQRGWLEAITPALLAASKGEVPPIRNFWAEAVKGSAKTTTISMAILWAIAFSRRPLRIKCGAYDREQASEIQVAAQEILWSLPWLSKRVTINSLEISCKATGSTCNIVTTDSKGTSGVNADIIVMDECVQITKREFAEHMLANASKRFDAITIISTNAGFRQTWQYALREIARSSPDWSFHQGLDLPPQMTTSSFELARAFNTTTFFNRFYLGVWPSGVGDALDPDAVNDALTLEGPMMRRMNNWQYILGLDLGISHDHSAMAIVGCEQGKNRVVLVDCKSWTPPRGGKVDLATVERAVIEAHRRYHLSSVEYDFYQAEHMAQNFRRQGMIANAHHFGGKDANKMATTLLETVNARILDLYDGPLIRDLFRLTLTENSSGYKLTSTKDSTGGHADLATALCLALPAATTLAHYRAFVRTAPERHEFPAIDAFRHGVQIHMGRPGPSYRLN